MRYAPPPVCLSAQNVLTAVIVTLISNVHLIVYDRHFGSSIKIEVSKQIGYGRWGLNVLLLVPVEAVRFCSLVLLR